MFIVTFIVALVFTIAAAIIFCRGLIMQYNNDHRAQSTMRNGYLIWIFGILAACVIFVFFSI